MVRIAAVLVLIDVGVDKPKFAVLDQRVGVAEVDMGGTDRLDLGTGQNDTGLEFFEEEVVV